MLSELTAPTVPVANESQLKEVSGKNQWSTALVLMLEACTTPRLGQGDREKLMKVNYISVNDRLLLVLLIDMPTMTSIVLPKFNRK